MAMTRIIITIPEDMLLQVDGRRGDVPRSAWVRRVIEQRLASATESVAVGSTHEVTPQFKRGKR